MRGWFILSALAFGCDSGTDGRCFGPGYPFMRIHVLEATSGVSLTNATFTVGGYPATYAECTPYSGPQNCASGTWTLWGSVDADEVIGVAAPGHQGVTLAEHFGWPTVGDGCGGNEVFPVETVALPLSP